jgi:O-antigen/teichoic acid export membrane protein
MIPEFSERVGYAMRWQAGQLVGVQGLSFIRFLVLAWLLPPEAFGLLAIATIALNVLMQLSDVGMIPALVHQRDATPEQQDTAWTIGLLRSLVVAIALFAVAPAVANLFGEASAAPIVQALGLRPMIQATASIRIAQLTRELRFRELAMMSLAGAIVDIVTAVTTAPWLGVWALVAGPLASAAAVSFLSYVYAPHRPRLTLRTPAVVPLVAYGRWIMAASIAALVANVSIQLILSRTLGTAALGLYFLASRVAFLLVDAASQVVGAVAFPMFSSVRDDARRTAATFGRLIAGQAVVLLPAYCILFVLAPSLEAALGSRWDGTAPVLRILLASSLIGLLVELLGILFMGTGRPDRRFWVLAIKTVLLLLVLWPLVGALGVSGAALVSLTANAGAVLLGIVWLRRTVPGQSIARPAALGAAAAAAVIGFGAAALVSTPDLTGLIAGGVCGAAAACAVLIALDRRFDLQLRELLFLTKSTADPGR